MLRGQSRHRLAIASVLIAMMGAASAQSAVQSSGVDFKRDVQPIFAQHCVQCHGPEKQKGGLRLDTRAALIGGDSGKVIQPQNSNGSLLIQMVTGKVELDPDAIMPPKGKRLTPKQIDTLRQWIKQGADWPKDADGSPARSSHWSLQPLTKTKPPSPVFKDWHRNDIDLFTASRLKAKGLAPAKAASRRALIRRLSFDLIGLPPSPQEINAFVNDTRPGAYERLVDRLLASPHYGERWARHWLDVVRFGESHGFEYNQPRNNAWHYRNWVIEALNNDLPYDKFVRMQLAGDVLAKDDPTMVAATGFLVAGPHNTTLPSSQNMRKTMKQDEYEDLVGTIGQTFLGLTINCARCHSHKFDPISLREYYSFVAAVAGVAPGERTVQGGGKDAEKTKAIAELTRQRDDSLKQLRALESDARQRVLAARKKGEADKPQPPKPVARWEFNENLNDSIGVAHGEAVKGARIENGMLVVGPGGAYVRTKPIAFDLKEKTLEAWVKLDNLNQRGGGVMNVQTIGGVTFDAIVYGEREQQRWMAGSDFFRRYDSFQAPAEEQAHRKAVHIAIVYQADGTIIGYRNGKPYGQGYRKSLQPFKAGQSQIVFGLRHEPAGGNRHLSAKIDRAQLHNRALSPEEVAASAGADSDYVPEQQLVAAMSADQLKQRRALQAKLASIEAKVSQLRQSLKPYKVYAVTPRNPGEIRVLRRGNVTQPGEVVTPAGIAAVPGASADFALNTKASDTDRRTKLSQWITHEDNALFARVIVNRIWHYHFGTGIVDTPSDFGVNGGKPSHPQLLDWLAGEMIRRGWSMKQMHRLIVTSATYRQSTKANSTAMKIDADNRLLWRMSPRRLEAEALRDAILSVSGQLNKTVGGVGYRDVREYKYKGSHFYDPIQPTGSVANRRTVYRFAPRGAKKTMLDTFDCPDPSAMAPNRAVTTTPLQALTLMNNPFVLTMADRFAARVQDEVKDVEGQVKRIYELAYGRPVTNEELADAKAFVAEHGLAAFCRVVFNSNEFLYVQ